MQSIGLLPAHSRRKPLRTALISLAALEAGFALLQSLALFDPDAQRAHGYLAERVMTTHLIVAPIFAVAAIAFAALDQLRQFIVAFGAVALTTWASELISAHFTGVTLIAADIVRPVIAVFAITLAVGRIWLCFATLLVAGMWIIWFWNTFLSDFLPFLFGVILYGA